MDQSNIDHTERHQWVPDGTKDKEPESGVYFITRDGMKIDLTKRNEVPEWVWKELGHVDGVIDDGSYKRLINKKRWIYDSRHIQNKIKINPVMEHKGEKRRKNDKLAQFIDKFKKHYRRMSQVGTTLKEVEDIPSSEPMTDTRSEKEITDSEKRKKKIGQRIKEDRMKRGKCETHGVKGCEECSHENQDPTEGMSFEDHLQKQKRRLEHKAKTKRGVVKSIKEHSRKSFRDQTRGK